MKKKVTGILLLVSFLFSLSSCFGPHNQAEIEAQNLDSERIYGDRNDVPRQMKAPYEEDETGEMADRAIAIREKLYPN